MHGRAIAIDCVAGERRGRAHGGRRAEWAPLRCVRGGAVAIGRVAGERERERGRGRGRRGRERSLEGIGLKERILERKLGVDLNEKQW